MTEPDSDTSETRAARVGVAPVPALIVTTILALLACGWALPAPYFSDDFLYVVRNTQLQSVPLTEFWRFFTTRTNPYEFLPVRDLSYRLDYALFGLDPAGFRVHNLLLYGLACLGAWLVSRSVIRILRGATEERDAWTAAAATALFAAHPAHVEAVVWISGRKDLLSAVFGLFCLWQISVGLLEPDRRRLRWTIAGVLYALALLSKAAVLPLAGVAALLAFVHAARGAGPGRAALRALLATLPLAVLAGLGFWLAMRVGGEAGIRFDPVLARARHPGGALETALRILGGLSGIAILPIRLRFLYDVGSPGLAGAALVGAGAAALLAGAAGVYFAWRRRSLVGIGVATFVLLCLPYLQLVPFKTISLASERFVFLAVLGPTLALAALLQRLGHPWRQRCALLLLVGGLFLTKEQAIKWRNGDRLILDAAAHSPGLFQAQYLAVERVLVPAKRYDEARAAAAGVRDAIGRRMLREYAECASLADAGDHAGALRAATVLDGLVGRDVSPELVLLLASVHEKSGRPFEAAGFFQRSLRHGAAGDVRAQAEAGLRRVRGSHAERLGHLRRSVEAVPRDWDKREELADLESDLYLLQEALHDYERILAAQPARLSATLGLGLVHLRRGRFLEARHELRRAIDGGLDSAEAWDHLATAENSLGRFAEAEEALARALSTDSEAWEPAFHLGRLRMRLGNVEGARRAFRTAVERGGEREVVLAWLEAIS